MKKRNTIQYALVLETVNQLQCHATADEIYETINQAHPTVSRATVYRNLQRLSEAGKIQKVEIPGGADRYDHICRRHYHVRCIKCGRVFDVDMDYLEELEKSIHDRHGFTFTGHSIVFSGICPTCNPQKPRFGSLHESCDP